MILTSTTITLKQTVMMRKISRLPQSHQEMHRQHLMIVPIRAHQLKKEKHQHQCYPPLLLLQLFGTGEVGADPLTRFNRTLNQA